MAAKTQEQNESKKRPAFEAVRVEKGKQGFIGGDRPIEKGSKSVRLYADQVESVERVLKDSGWSRSDFFRHLVDLYLGQNDQTPNSA